MRWGRAVLRAGCLTTLVLFLVLGISVFLWRESGLPLEVATFRPGAVSAVGQADRSLNRIAVANEEGNILLLAPDGEERIELTTDATSDRRYHYPTWSPDGQHLAFVELALDGEGRPVESTIHVVPMADQDASRQFPTDHLPFYLSWSPTGELLAFLSTGASEERIALEMLAIGEDTGEVRTVREGQPFFFSWAPGGRSMLAHIGEELLFLDGNGDATSLPVETGPFQAPHWSADGTSLAFVVQAPDDQSVLSMSDRHGNELTELERSSGFFTFNWSPAGGRIAYSFTDEQVGLPAYGPLWVKEPESGRAWELSKRPVIAFFWSPDGESLAFLRPDFRPPEQDDPASQTTFGGHRPRLWLRWHIWDGERTYPLARFSPSDPFLVNYLRYFDQYAQSMTLWSPDSRSLIYAGRSENGRRGIWILPVEEGSRPTLLHEGILASWSPN